MRRAFAPLSRPPMPQMSRESMEFDVVVIGAGPAGLATACRLAQLARAASRELTIGVVEKGAAVGAHIVSGAVFEPRALDELFPDWRERGAPVKTPVTAERVEWLTSATGQRACARHRSCRVRCTIAATSSSAWAICANGSRAKPRRSAVSVLPGFAAADVLYDGERVAGVVTGDMGVARDGSRKASYQPGYELRAKYTVFAEGCRGHLGRRLEARFDLRASADPQHLRNRLQGDLANRRGEASARRGRAHARLAARRGDGRRRLRLSRRRRARVRRVHRRAWSIAIRISIRSPSSNAGSSIRRYASCSRAASASRTARAPSTRAGSQSLPKLTFPGGVLVGCEAGFLNPAKIKGSHTAMKSGMLAAETIFAALAQRARRPTPSSRATTSASAASWVWEELHRGRNFSAGIAKLGTLLGGALAFVEQNLLGGRAPWTLHNRVEDHARLREAADAPRPRYPKPDGVVSFDRASSVFLSSTAHEENQPCHLDARGPERADRREPAALSTSPRSVIVPAGVYEVVADASGAARFRINATNCVHCKTCDIKDPAQNITWVPPEGGGGPNYSGM